MAEHSGQREQGCAGQDLQHKPLLASIFLTCKMGPTCPSRPPLPQLLPWRPGHPIPHLSFFRGDRSNATGKWGYQCAGIQPEGGQRAPGGNREAEGALQASSLTGPLTSSLCQKLHGGGKRPSQHSGLDCPWAWLSSVLCGSGMAVLLHPTLPVFPVPLQRGRTETCRGSLCALSCSGWGVTAWFVLVHTQFQVGLEFSREGSAWGEYGSHWPPPLNGGR